MVQPEDARRRLAEEEARLQELRGRQQGWLSDLREQDDTQEPDQQDAHYGDRAAQLAHREQEAAIHAELGEQLSQIEAARERVEEGTYGVCEVCGGAIDVERLQVRPATLHCREHA